MKSSKIVQTAMQYRYLLKFGIRVSIFLTVLFTYLFNKDLLTYLMNHRFAIGLADFHITLLHVLWAIFMFMMIRHLHPVDNLTMALRKSEEKEFRESKNYDEVKLLRFVQDMNLKSWIVLLVWLSFNAIFGLLYVFDIIDEADLLMLTVFYFLCDYICILFFCPFQSFIMKNKCCVNCRIYDWGHFMMFTPLLFIRNFFSWSLFFTSIIVLIRWEIIYAKHPERFWEGTNDTLKCINCKDKTCKYKKTLL